MEKKGECNKTDRQTDRQSVREGFERNEECMQSHTSSSSPRRGLFYSTVLLTPRSRKRSTMNNISSGQNQKRNFLCLLRTLDDAS
mmetsp:Transcript_23563/g.35800  ORF Transcript_23563/g.35800 Transcript_23563/m.35800 type:complete len:85 (+) Transcript_23563:1072-1326(+)